MKTFTLGLFCVVALAGCSKGSEEVTAAWKKAGLTHSEFKDVGEKVKGGKCFGGKVDGFDATLCEFENGESAKKAEDLGLELIGGSVGSSLAGGRMLLVVADPKQEDPTGRRLNGVINAFKKQTK